MNDKVKDNTDSECDNFKSALDEVDVEPKTLADPSIDNSIDSFDKQTEENNSKILQMYNKTYSRLETFLTEFYSVLNCMLEVNDDNLNNSFLTTKSIEIISSRKLMTVDESGLDVIQKFMTDFNVEDCVINFQHRITVDPFILKNRAAMEAFIRDHLNLDHKTFNYEVSKLSKKFFEANLLLYNYSYLVDHRILCVTEEIQPIVALMANEILHYLYGVAGKYKLHKCTQENELKCQLVIEENGSPKKCILTGIPDFYVTNDSHIVCIIKATFPEYVKENYADAEKYRKSCRSQLMTQLLAIQNKSIESKNTFIMGLLTDCCTVTLIILKPYDANKGHEFIITHRVSSPRSMALVFMMAMCMDAAAVSNLIANNYSRHVYQITAAYWNKKLAASTKTSEDCEIEAAVDISELSADSVYAYNEDEAPNDDFYSMYI